MSSAVQVRRASGVKVSQAGNEPRVDRAYLEELAREAVPIAGDLGIRIEELSAGRVVARVPYRKQFIRPGATIAGPVMMTLADFAMWAAVLSLIGPQHMAVTTNLNINFLRRPPPADLLARASILKMGRRLAVGEIGVYGGEDEELVAHVTCTYSIPPEAMQE